MLVSTRRWRLSCALLIAALAALVLVGVRQSSVAYACAFSSLPQTYESMAYRSDYPYLMDLAAYDLLFPEDNEFGRQRLKQGPRIARVLGGGHVPPALLKSIGYVESRWQMGSAAIPYGGTGDALASVIGDCGYGIMQVTSGMTVALGENGPSPVQALIATHFAYNIARGTAILANKWNEGDEFRPIVGGGDPNILEHWYFAVWGYNGFSLDNHPFSPRYANPLRVPYSCNTSDSLGHDRSQYPYQELVYGCMARPPVRDGSPLWTPQPAGLPNLLDPQVRCALDLRNFVFPYDKMDLYVPCVPPPPPPTPSPTPTGTPNPFASPTPSSTPSPTPTPFPTPTPSPVPTPPPTPPTQTRDPSSAPSTDRRAALVGAPSLRGSPSQIDISLTTGPGASQAPQMIEVRNTGAGVGPWIAVSSVPWLTPVPEAGVAIGSDIRCQSETNSCNREPEVALRLDLAALKTGQNTATLRIFSPQQPQTVHTVTVRVQVSRPGETQPVSRELLPGCNAVGVAASSATEVEQFAANVQPSSAIDILWRLPQGGAWELYLPGRAEISTLRTVNADEGVFVCVKERATLTQTTAVAGPSRPLPLATGCSFVAVSQDGTAAAFASSVQPANAVLALWRFDTAANQWLPFLPAAPDASRLTDVKRLDGLFVCTNAAATLTQPTLAPPATPTPSASPTATPTRTATATRTPTTTP